MRISCGMNSNQAKNNSALWPLDVDGILISKRIEVSSHPCKIQIDNKCAFFAPQFIILQNESVRKRWEWICIFCYVMHLSLGHMYWEFNAFVVRTAIATATPRIFIWNESLPYILFTLCHVILEFYQFEANRLAIPSQNELTKSSANAPFCLPSHHLAYEFKLLTLRLITVIIKAVNVVFIVLFGINFSNILILISTAASN